MRLSGDTAQRLAGAFLVLLVAALIWTALVLLWSKAAERSIPPVAAGTVAARAR
jgi:hypothetical protein